MLQYKTRIVVLFASVAFTFVHVPFRVVRIIPARERAEGFNPPVNFICITMTVATTLADSVFLFLDKVLHVDFSSAVGNKSTPRTE